MPIYAASRLMLYARPWSKTLGMMLPARCRALMSDFCHADFIFTPVAIAKRTPRRFEFKRALDDLPMMLKFRLMGRRQGAALSISSRHRRAAGMAYRRAA